MPKLESMSLAVRKKHHLAANNVKQIHPPKKSVIDVAQKDYAMVPNNKDAYLYIDTRGAGPCIAIAIRSADQTLVAHIDEDKIDVTDDKDNVRSVGSRADQNLHEILESMLDLVSQDRSKIESIGLLSTQEHSLRVDENGKPRYGGTHADEVWKYLMEKAGLSDECAIHLGTMRNDLIVQLKDGSMMAMENQVRNNEYVNVDHKGNHTGTYPEDVAHGKLLELAVEDSEKIMDAKAPLDKNNEHNNEMASAANEDDKEDETAEKDDNAPPETANDGGTPSLEDNAQADQMLSADNNNDNDNDNALPEIDNSNNDSGGGANEVADSPGVEMGGGMDDMDNELDMNNEMME